MGGEPIVLHGRGESSGLPPLEVTVLSKLGSPVSLQKFLATSGTAERLKSPVFGGDTMPAGRLYTPAAIRDFRLAGSGQPERNARHCPGRT